MTRAALFTTALAAGLSMTAACSPPCAAQQAPAPAPAPTPTAAPLTFQSSGDTNFDAWRQDFAARAVAQGRNPAVVQQILGPLTPDPGVLQADQNQAEFVRPVWDYINRSVTPERVAAGKTLREANAGLFADIERKYGVDADIIAGIWAVETNFGTVALPYDAPRAIATLAAQGRRRAQFEGYLLALIQMVEKGYAGAAQLKGSWAGALGQPQFMPDVYLSTAVDWDNDGKRDIWTDTADVLASIANYLASHGWRRNEPVYDEVLLPRDFDYSLADGTPRPISQWVQLGAHSTSGYDYTPTVLAMQAELFLPAGAEGPALLLFPNFKVIRTYNASDRYAMSVSLLARGFEGGNGLAARWPVEIGSLQRDEITDLQTTLTKLGYPAGTADGQFGTATRKAVRQFQQASGLAPDGYPSKALYEAVKNKDLAIRRAAEQRAAPALKGGQIVTLQQALIKLRRLPAGSANGIVGPKTHTAIEAFERSMGLDPLGEPTTFILEEAQDAVAKLPPPPPPKKKVKIRAKAKAKAPKRHRR